MVQKFTVKWEQTTDLSKISGTTSNINQDTMMGLTANSLNSSIIQHQSTIMKIMERKKSQNITTRARRDWNSQLRIHGHEKQIPTTKRINSTRIIALTEADPEKTRKNPSLLRTMTTVKSTQKSKTTLLRACTTICRTLASRR